MGRTGNPGVLQSVGSQRVKQTERLNNSKWDTERQCGTFSSSHICCFVVEKLIFRKIFKLQDFSIFDMIMLLFINMTMSKCLFYRTCSFIKNILSWIFFFLFLNTSSDWGFPGGSEVKESSLPMQEIGDADSVPGSGRSPGKPFQYSCLENPTDRATSQAIVVHSAAKSRTLTLCV